VNGTVQSRDANGNLVNVSLNDTAATTLTGSLGRQSGEGVGNYAITNGSLARRATTRLTINTTGANETIGGEPDGERLERHQDLRHE
jgi:hypothetical protein